MKKLIAAIVALALLATPAQAWYRGGGYGWRGPVYNNYNYYGGGWGRGYGYGWGGYGAAAGIGLGLGLLGGAIASQQRYYGAAQCPVYDAWGYIVGYSYC